MHFDPAVTEYLQKKKFPQVTTDAPWIKRLKTLSSCCFFKSLFNATLEMAAGRHGAVRRPLHRLHGGRRPPDADVRRHLLVPGKREEPPRKGRRRPFLLPRRSNTSLIDLAAARRDETLCNVRPNARRKKVSQRRFFTLHPLCLRDRARPDVATVSVATFSVPFF